MAKGWHGTVLPQLNEDPRFPQSPARFDRRRARPDSTNQSGRTAHCERRYCGSRQQMSRENGTSAPLQNDQTFPRVAPSSSETRREVGAVNLEPVTSRVLEVQRVALGPVVL